MMMHNIVRYMVAALMSVTLVVLIASAVEMFLYSSTQVELFTSIGLFLLSTAALGVLSYDLLRMRHRKYHQPDAGDRAKHGRRGDHV